MDCTDPRPTRRWLGGISEGLAMDRLGIDVDQWHNARTHRMPSTRDECEQYTLSPREATRSVSGGDSKRAGTEPRATREQVDSGLSYPYPAVGALLPRAHMPPPQRLSPPPAEGSFSAESRRQAKRTLFLPVEGIRPSLPVYFSLGWKASPSVFVDIYAFDLCQLGLAVMGLLVGAVVAYIIFVIWFRFSEGKKFDDDGRRKPEERFVPLMAACILIPLSLFSFGWSARIGVHWIVPIIGSGLFSLGTFSLFVSLVGQYLG